MGRLPQGVRKRKDGLFEKRFTVNKQRYSIYGITTKELNEKEQEVRNLIQQGCYKENKNITLDDYFMKWLNQKQIDTKGNSLSAYKSIYKNHFQKKLGKYKIREIERRQIKEIQAELSKEFCAKTCNHYISILKIILNDAVRDEIIPSNPANNIKGIKEIKAENKTDTHRSLTITEQNLFMQEARNSYYYELFALALCTGMRFGELCALTWGDIDFTNNMIHVNKTQTKDINNLVTIGTTKTRAGNRDIPITDTTKQILKLQKEKRAMISNIRQFDIDKTPVFVSVYEKTIYNSTVNNEINHICDRIQEKGVYIERFTVHAFRHTFATRYREQGGQAETLQKILGHDDFKMTRDVYIHVLPDTMRNEMQKLVINI